MLPARGSSPTSSPNVQVKQPEQAARSTIDDRFETDIAHRKPAACSGPLEPLVRHRGQRVEMPNTTNAEMTYGQKTSITPMNDLRASRHLCGMRGVLLARTKIGLMTL